MGQYLKRDNDNLESKLALRRHFLDAYHCDGAISVLDCCMGSGMLWSELRRSYACKYWGVDVKPKRGRLQIDSVRILAQAGWTQNVIDVDTYGAPWRHWFALLPNVRQPTTVFLTIGFVPLGGVHHHILDALGLGKIKPPSGIATKLHDLGLPYLLAFARRHRLEIVEAGETPRGKHAQYIGVHLRPTLRQQATSGK